MVTLTNPLIETGVTAVCETCFEVLGTMTSSATHPSLLSRIRENDGAAWVELIELYSPLVAFWCRKQGITESEVNDSVQEIFFAVSRSIDGYAPAGTSGSFRAWLWSVSRHKIIDGLRRSGRIPAARGGSTALHRVQQVPEDIDPNDDSEQIAFTQVLHRAMDQVRSEFQPKTWQAFWRTTIDGLTVASVAEELSLSTATIRQHRSRVLRRLREQLGESTSVD